MDPQENLRIVQEGYADYSRGDFISLLAKFGDDIEWVIPGPWENPFAAERHGLDQVAMHFELLSKVVEFSSFEPQEFIEKGDRVVVLGRYAGRVKSTGRHFHSEWAMAFTLRDGKIVKFREYNDTANIAAAFSTTMAAAGGE
jgi:ketosteroid isomerase-like protein